MFDGHRSTEAASLYPAGYALRQPQHRHWPAADGYARAAGRLRHQHILNQEYGVILADNGSDWFITDSPDERCNPEVLNTLKKVSKNLEIVKMKDIVTK